MAKTQQLKVIAKATDQVSPVLKEIRTNFRGLAKETKGLSENLAGLGALTLAPLAGTFAAAAAAVKGSIASTVEYASGVDDMAQSLGFAGEELSNFRTQLQEYRYAAQLSGASAEQMDSALAMLNRNLANAAAGKNEKLSELLKYLGISLKDANGQMRNAADLMPELADAMAAQTNSTQKAYIATTAFGRAGQALIPLLQSGSDNLADLAAEARRYGAVMGPEQIEQAAAMGDSFDHMGYAVQGLKNSIGSELIPVVKPLLDDMSLWIADNREWIATEIGDEVKDFAGALREIDLKELVKDGVEFTKTALALFNAMGGLKTIGIGVAGIYGLKVAGSMYKTASGIIGVTGSALKLGKSALPLLAARMAMAKNTFLALSFAAYPALSGISKGLGVAGGAVRAFGSALLTTPVGWFLGIAAAIGGAAYLIYKKWDKVGPYFETAWDGITLPFRAGWNAVSTIWDNLCELPDVIKNEGFAGLPGWFGRMFDDVKDAALSPFNELYNKIANLIPEGIKNSWTNLKNWFFNLDLVKGISETIDKGLNFFTGDSPTMSTSPQVDAMFNPNSPLAGPLPLVAPGAGTWNGALEIKVSSDNNSTAEIINSRSSGDGLKVTANTGYLR